MDKKSIGLYEKFKVERTDGSSAPGGKHDGCAYFVLDLTHDRHATPAIEAYAASCEADYPFLARDLRRLAQLTAASSALLIQKDEEQDDTRGGSVPRSAHGDLPRRNNGDK